MKTKFFHDYKVLMMDLEEFNESSENNDLEPTFARFYAIVHNAYSKEHAMRLAENENQNCEAVDAEKI